MSSRCNGVYLCHGYGESEVGGGICRLLYFYAGEPDRKLLEDKPEGFVIMVPQNEAWAMLIEKCFPDARRVTRYAIKKTQNSIEKHCKGI